MNTPNLDRLMEQAEQEAIIDNHYNQSFGAAALLFSTHGPALVAVLKEVVHAKQMEIGLSTEMQIAIHNAENLLTQLDREAKG